MKNYAYKLVGEIGVRVLSTGFLLLLARVVGAADFGIYSTAFAFASIFAILMDLGTNPLVTREIARYPEKRSHIIASVNFLKLMTAVVMLVCLWAVTQLIDMPWEKARLIPWLGWVVVGTAFTEYLGAVFTGLEQMGTEAIVKIIGKGVVIVASLATLAWTREVYPTVQVMGVFSILSIGVAIWIARARLGRLGLLADTGYLRKLLARAVPFFGAWAFMILYASQGILILNVFKIPDHDIGVFALASKIIDVLKVLPVLLASSVFPALSRQAQLSKEAFRDRARDLLRNAAIGFPILTGLMYFLAPLFLEALYGQSYQEAVQALRWLLVGFLFMAFNLILLYILIALDKEKESLLGAATISVGHILASLVLVPRYGMMGTCYAVIIAEAVALCLQAYLAREAVMSLSDRFQAQEAELPL